MAGPRTHCLCLSISTAAKLFASLMLIIRLLCFVSGLYDLMEVEEFAAAVLGEIPSSYFEPLRIACVIDLIYLGITIIFNVILLHGLGKKDRDLIGGMLFFLYVEIFVIFLVTVIFTIILATYINRNVAFVFSLLSLVDLVILGAICEVISTHLKVLSGGGREGKKVDLV